MPSAEYFGDDEHDPDYQDSVTRAQSMLFDELCMREPRLAVTLKQAKSYDAKVLYTHPVYASDSFPQRINTHNLPDFPRNVGATILLPWKDDEGEAPLGKVVTSTHRQIEIDTSLLRASIAAMPQEMQYAVRSDVENRFREDVLPEPPKHELIMARIRAELLAHMCRLDNDLYQIAIRPNQYPVSYLIDMAAMPVTGPLNVFTGKHPVMCNVETTITTRPELSHAVEEPFGNVLEITDQHIFLNDALTNHGLATLSDAQRRLLYEGVLEDMAARHTNKFEELGTDEERAGIRQMFANALYKLLVAKPRHLQEAHNQLVSRYQNFRRN